MMLSNAKVILQGRHNTVRDSRMARACSWGIQMTSQLHQAPRLRMSGAIPIRPLYAFTAWIGISLPPKRGLFFVGCHAVTTPNGLCDLSTSLILGQAHIRLNAARRVKKDLSGASR